MFEGILRLIRDKVRELRYVLTIHAEEEMDEDDLGVFDVERAILTGVILERQLDRETGDWKYVLEGLSVSDESVRVVVKLSPVGELIIITVYRA